MSGQAVVALMRLVARPVKAERVKLSVWRQDRPAAGVLLFTIRLREWPKREWPARRRYFFGAPEETDFACSP